MKSRQPYMLYALGRKKGELAANYLNSPGSAACRPLSALSADMKSTDHP